MNDTDQGNTPNGILKTVIDGLSDEALQNRGGGIYSIHQESAAQLLDYLEELVQRNELKEIVFEFVTWVKRLCESDPYGFVDMRNLITSTGKSRSGILKWSQKLEVLGLISKTHISVPGVKSQVSFNLLSYDPARLPSRESDSTFLANVLESNVLSEEGEMDAIAESYWLDSTLNNKITNFIKGDYFSIFILFPVLPTDTMGEKEEYEVPVFIDKDRLIVKVYPQAGHKASMVRDLQVLLAVQSIIYKRFKHGYEIKNPLRFSITEILEELGWEKWGSNHNRVWDALCRFEKTGFEIKFGSRSVIDRYDLELNHFFRIVNEITVLTLKTKKGVSRKDIFTIELNSKMLRRLTSKEGQFVATLPKELYHESNPFVFSVAIWLKRVIRHKKHPMKFDKRKLHTEINIRSKYKYFSARWKDMMQKFAVPGSPGVARVYGYLITAADDSASSFLIKADPQDKLVGTKSYRARIIEGEYVGETEQK